MSAGTKLQLGVFTLLCCRTPDNGLGPEATASLVAVLNLLPQLECLDFNCRSICVSGARTRSS